MSYSTLVTHGASLSESIEISRSVMNNKIQTANNRNDVSTNTLNIFDDRYYSVNKQMLCFLGIWPYQSNIERRMKFCLLLLISSSIMVPQLRAVVLTWGRLDAFVECFSPLATHIACDIKLINIVLQLRKLRNLLDKTQQDWERVRNLKQVDSIKKFAENARHWSILWLAIVYSVVGGWLVMALTPKILDALHPLNHSRTSFDVIPLDYGIDPVKYWLPINIHIWSVVPVILLVMPAVDTLYICFAQHVCAMFEILRYNFGNILEDDGNINIKLKLSNHEDYYYQQIVVCIKRHKYLVKYIKDVESTCETCLFLVLGMNMLGLSMTGYQAVAEDTSLEDTIRYALFATTILIHLFVTTLPGHWIMSSSDLFSDFAFYSKWYMMSLRSRKLIILIIRASIKPCSITAGKLYVLSMGNFCSVLKTSLSYMAMLTSIQ